MGNFIGKAMDDNMKKQQEFMLKTQELMLERQLAMQNEMRERQMAALIAKSRDYFMFWMTFYSIAATGLTAGALKGNKKLFAPLVPLTIVTAYNWDISYGNKLERIREEANRILDEEHGLLELPHGMPSFSQVEAARLKQKSNEPYKQGHDIFL